MNEVLLGNLLTVMIVLSLPAILPVVIKPYGANRFGPPAASVPFTQAINTVLRKIVDFKGRASRSEFWWNALAYGLGYVAVAYWAQQTSNTTLGLLALLLFAPFLAVGVRRLHDINRTGWWLLIGPIGLGAVALVVLLLWPSQKERA